MWKRLQQRPRPAIGDPVLIGTTLDESTYGSSTTGFGIKERPQRPERSESEDTLKELPRSPLEIEPPPPFRNSKFRPTSSIYSQPSPEPGARFARYSYNNPGGISYEEEVSPPSSPEYETSTATISYNPKYPSEGEVSPIEEMAEVEQYEASRPESRPSQSNIPTLRREKRRNQTTTPATNVPPRKEVGRIAARNASGGETRFDKYTGEPTTSDNGGRLGVKPGHFTPPSLRSAGSPVDASRPSSNPATKNQPSFSDRLRKLGKTTPTSTTERPEWKGSSGRVALVSPVQDQHDMPPLSLPRKNTAQVPTPPVSPAPVSVIRSVAPETKPKALSMPQKTNPAMRSVPRNTGRDIPRTLPSPEAYISDDTKTQQAYPGLSDAQAHESQVTSGRGQTRSNAASDEVANTSNQLHTSATAIERNFREAIKGVAVPPEDEEPPSRFSVTTHAPSTAYNTPRPSNDDFDHDMPPMPPSRFESSPSPDSIINRKRPNVGEPPKAISRKQVGNTQYNSSVVINMRDTPRRTSSIASSSFGKTLPMSPAELASRDLITALHAQIDDLMHRRNNISKSIRQMTELMPTDHIVLTDEVRRKRELEKTKIENLRAEEDDIRQQEHDLGLRLHRAYKRREKDACYEPIGFWVRRATG